MRSGRDSGTSGGLAKRTITVSALISVIIGTAFFLLALAIEALRDSESRADHALELQVAANRLERVVVDIDATQRGFVITRAPAFLEPWNEARSEFARQASAMERLATAGDEGQGRSARQIAGAGRSYIGDYSVPLVQSAQRDRESARTVSVTLEGNRRIDKLRDGFEQFRQREEQIFDARQDSASATANQALAAASVGVAGSIVLIVFSGGYLARSVVRPVRRAAGMAGRVAGGDLTTRMPENGPGEVGSLERSFNSMADSLAASRDELTASRARVVTAADNARRRIERDLHDGTQQRLISLALELRAAESRVRPDQPDVAEQWSRTAQGLTEVVDDLREISRGLHPAILEKGGLGPAVRSLARRASVRVELDADVTERLPDRVEVAAYYVVSEALTNAVKYAQAPVVTVSMDVADEILRLRIHDDGIGGADPSAGSGLVGLRDRVEAVGGRIEIVSPPGQGTSLRVTIPAGS
ncbi:MAG TPA: CHASE3 domain-containing protein [Streptosporangiaceae bacterium]|nr:CHASE3 domain-containing protein [Streptosporangiaceae bacterium]